MVDRLKQVDWLRVSKIVFGLVSIALILQYNLVHTGELLTSFNSAGQSGNLAALGVELSVIYLSAQISIRRRSKQSIGFFLFSLASVVIVSGVANMVQGYAVKYGRQFEWYMFDQVDIAQRAAWILSTGMLSLLAFALSEMLGDDLTASKPQPAAQPAATPVQAPAEVLNVAEASSAPVNAPQSSQEATCSDSTPLTDNNTQTAPVAPEIAQTADLTADEIIATVPLTGVKMVDMLSCYAVAPKASMEQVANHIGCSREYVRQLLVKAVNDGKAQRNGQVTVAPR